MGKGHYRNQHRDLTLTDVCSCMTLAPELAWQLLKPTSSPSGWTKTWILNLLPLWSVHAPTHFPGSKVAGWQCWWLLQHTPSFSAKPEGLRWENKQTNNQKTPDNMAAKRKELWPNIYHSWKPTPCPHPTSTGKNAQARWIAVAMTAYALPPSFLLFRHHREWPMGKPRDWGQFVSKGVQKLHSILSSHTIQKRNMDTPRHLGAMGIKQQKDWDPLLPAKALQEPHTANNPYSFLSKSQSKTILPIGLHTV